jgi:hypothetical protein
MDRVGWWFLEHGRRRGTARVLATVVGAVLFVSSARAQVPGEELARRAFEEGVSLEKAGDYGGALAKFKESEQIKATLGNRYHKAYCLEMTGKLSGALIEYEIVDKAARETNKTELLEATRLRLEPLRTKVPRLALKLAAPAPRESEVALDGSPISPSLLDGKTFRIDPGQHVITAHAPDHEPFSKTFSAGENTSTSLDIVLQRAAKGEPKEDVSVPPPRGPGHIAPAPGGGPRTLPILTTVGAVALAAGGVGAFVLAANEEGELEGHCAAQRTPTCEGDRGPTRTFDALALGAWIGAAGLAALSVVLWTSKPSAPASAHATVVARSSWLGLEGRF